MKDAIASFDLIGTIEKSSLRCDMNGLVNILRQSEGIIGFQVDNVEIAIKSLPTRSPRGQLEDRLETPTLLFSHDDSFQGIQTAIDHPLVTAVHLAFSDHRPLILTPDSIWMTCSKLVMSGGLSLVSLFYQKKIENKIYSEKRLGLFNPKRLESLQQASLNFSSVS
ncbi:MAG: hypothetical protein SW833_02025 [Cyanobacteriota bacterium]|nr:hypothetical protein [Cyanobacteriota bacterium]